MMMQYYRGGGWEGGQLNHSPRRCAGRWDEAGGDGGKRKRKKKKKKRAGWCSLRARPSVDRVCTTAKRMSNGNHAGEGGAGIGGPATTRSPSARWLAQLAEANRQGLASEGAVLARRSAMPRLCGRTSRSESRSAAQRVGGGGCVATSPGSPLAAAAQSPRLTLTHALLPVITLRAARRLDRVPLRLLLLDRALAARYVPLSPVRRMYGADTAYYRHMAARRGRSPASSR